MYWGGERKESGQEEMVGAYPTEDLQAATELFIIYLFASGVFN